MHRAVFTFLAAALASVPAAAQHDYTGFHTTQTGPGIYIYVGPECTPAGLVTGNVTAIIGDEGVLIVDAGHFPSSARKMIAHLKTVTNKPVKHLLYTHWHQDHILGAIAFKKEWPALEVMAHPFTAKELAKDENGPGYSKMLQTNLPPAIERGRGMLASGKTPSGNELTESQRDSITEAVAAYSTSVREAPEMEFVAATRMIDKDTEISLGKRKVQIRFLGEANTEGDLIVYVPDAKTLLTGDMVVYPTPFALSSKLPVWIGTMGKLMAIDAVKIVPGHGPPMDNKEYMQDLVRLLQAMVEQPAALMAAGVPQAQAAAKIDVAWFRQKYVTSKLREGSFANWFLNPVIGNAYKAAGK